MEHIMKKLSFVVSVWLIISLTPLSWGPQNNSSATQVPKLATRTYALTNGQWFNGKTFERKTFYSVNGVLTTKKPSKVEAEIKLDDKFVVPPFAEAHNHNLGGSNGLDAQITKYLKEGVFYSKNMHYVRELTAPILNRVNIPSSVDVAYAHAGLTAPGGHAVALYERLLQQGVFPNWKKEDLDTRAFFIINDENDLGKKWDLILAGKPDFIKTYLEYSEEYEQRKDDPKYYGQRGLNPKLLPLIVQKAHAAGLRVSTHIETAADFHQALIAGVDEITHLPGYQIPNGFPVSAYQISDADAQLAAKKGIFVVTTTVLSLSFHGRDPQQLKVVQDNQVRNLLLLQKHQVKIALGSDTLNATSLAEAMNLEQLNVFDHLMLLKLWCEVTPQTIFPNRKLGRLQEGYEASFLVLEDNPLTDFANVKKIISRFKQGEMLSLPATTAK